MPIDTQGQRLWLLPDRTLWWPAARTLFVADAHFGKGATFRARGLPVPGGTTADNLARLGHALAERDVEHLVFLGDLLHAREA
ncbi:MAG TPA: DEAD/DEAH box helicase, partial [Ottowia sp.]|nr:DEAD/DEAH box helicase [Ottowia sp.]